MYRSYFFSLSLFFSVFLFFSFASAHAPSPSLVRRSAAYKNRLHVKKSAEARQLLGGLPSECYFPHPCFHSLLLAQQATTTVDRIRFYLGQLTS
jgi:hypothetical protein